MIWPAAGDKVFTNEDKTRYIRKFTMDSPGDAADLPSFDPNAAPGSTAFAITGSVVYMLNSQGDWTVL